ncbi:hypothetical protein BAS10_05570 [Elizabethkingia meningoseptica]|uniref:hypothetical protein n=1 Tax=Elizabethkingia meningoseptica TaxID=238 RepID=UPI0009997504|nr:hypothetical protein [Elizabethkingia meningoseptica]OPB99131.1 hypothetical protein BAS10_05570 [Elizabethkingia meningoseptica]
MILNKDYYQALWEKFEGTKTLARFKNNTSCLTTKLVLEHYKKSKPIHFNFQNSKETILEIAKHLFIECASDIYLNHYDLPNLTKGSKLRDKRKHLDGKKHDFIIKSIVNGSYSIEDIKNGAKSTIKYDELVKKFIPIGQGAKQRTLQGYTNFFADLHGDLKQDFTPTNFEQKTVFIAKKTLWDSLPDRNKIPCTYLPNPNEGCGLNPIKSIPALDDSLAYFTPKYEGCYSNILTKGEKVKTIIVFDTEADKIEQMLQDRSRFKFNLIIISNSASPIKNQSIPCWNWFKEEIEIVNAL